MLSSCYDVTKGKETFLQLRQHRGSLLKALAGLLLGGLAALVLGAAPRPGMDTMAVLPDARLVALGPAAVAGARLNIPFLTAHDWSQALDLPVAPAADRSWPKIAVVIDDLGLNHANTQRAIGLKGPLTLSFLPYGQGVAALAARAKAAGHELFVHLPMEPKEAAADPGPHVLRVGMEHAALARHIEWNLSRFTGFVGVNNHMGSRFTEDDDGMAHLFATLSARGLAFIDSRTTARSAGAWTAARQGLAYGERDIFLDNERAAPALAAQLAELERRARAQGTAIAIGHPHMVTLAALERWIASLPEKKLQLVPATTIIRERGSPLWRLAHDQGTAISQLAPGSK